MACSSSPIMRNARSWAAVATPFDFCAAREAWRSVAIAARGFHDEHVRFHILEPRAFQDRLIVKTNVPGKKERLLLAAHHNAGRTERMAGIVELDRRREKS